MISARTLRVLRIVGVVYMLLAIAYLVMPLDLDRVGWMGYIDDFFLFMSAFTFMNGAFQKARSFVVSFSYSRRCFLCFAPFGFLSSPPLINGRCG